MKIPDGYWICACVKRDRDGRLTHVKSNHPRTRTCRRCRMSRELATAIAARLAAAVPAGGGTT